MKKFNVTGNCIPSENYMVDISGKITQIKKFIDSGYYFTINRARQYGKTTTLYELRKRLKNEYTMAHISFQGIDYENFESTKNFCESFTRQVSEALKLTPVDNGYAEIWDDPNIVNFDLLSEHITDMCEGRKVVLIIDEVDRTSNSHVFLQFLSMLREKYIAYRNGDDSTFHSVILAGIHDIKYIKLKLLNERVYNPAETESKIYNLPWNIAVNFNVDMSFDPEEISTMLKDYESEHNTGMDITAISQEIYNYTNGYPFLVSRICQCIDEDLGKNWTVGGVWEAVKIILEEKNTLFDDVFKNLENDKELFEYIYELLILGDYKPYVIYNPIVSIGDRYGFFKKIGNENNRVAIFNKIFELLMTNYYISKDLFNKRQISNILLSDVVKEGKFDMELCFRKFAEHYAEF